MKMVDYLVLGFTSMLIHVQSKQESSTLVHFWRIKGFWDDFSLSFFRFRKLLEWWEKNSYFVYIGRQFAP
jgi:hypothetical protein